ncbi:MAG: ATP-binding protein [Eubacterium sp.]|nr:ATP-binding protein [Eubacterium sp.]
MVERASRWIMQGAFLVSGFLYVHTIERKPEQRKKTCFLVGVFILFFAVMNYFYRYDNFWTEMAARTAGFLLLGSIVYTGRKLSLFAAYYYTIWAFCSWQLMYEWFLVCLHMGADYWPGRPLQLLFTETMIFGLGYLIVAITIGRIIPDKGKKSIGPRQLLLALATFFNFQIVAFLPGDMEYSFLDLRWMVVYIVQLLLCIVLYLQNELFKKSELRKELEIMGLLWQKEKEHYQLSRENMSFLSQKVHDLKHHIQAMRNASREEIERYLAELEGSVKVYESIIQTGSGVLDTILTEKSLYCKDHGITISCMADGSQMDFMNTVDLYAVLGNALDNAIEEVEKFQEKELRQIDVLIYRKQQFLAIHITNPMEQKDGKLEYEEGLPVTTKGNRLVHGFGLRSIRHILKKYDGFLTIREEDGCFSLLMLIPVPVQAVTTTSDGSKTT